MQRVVQTHPVGAVSDALADVDRQIERLEAELDAKRAIRAQLIQERRLAQLFPLDSGFVRRP